jgi:hypothetical protein
VLEIRFRAQHCGIRLGGEGLVPAGTATSMATASILTNCRTATPSLFAGEYCRLEIERTTASAKPILDALTTCAVALIGAPDSSMTTSMMARKHASFRCG